MRATSAGRGRSVGDDMTREIKRRRAWMVLTLSVLLLCLVWVLGASTSAANRFEVERVWKQGPGKRMGLLSTHGNRSRAEIGSGEKRAALYDRMGADLEQKGAAFLNGGETSQSLKLSDLFNMNDGKVVPILKPVEPPVRATVLHLDSHYASQISEVVKKILSPYFSGGPIWYQDESLYHFSLFHASHHLESVAATESEVEAEAAAVLGGTDPAVIRQELRNSLPNAPSRQLYDPVILHTSIARILGPPKLTSAEGSGEDYLAFMKSLVRQINAELINFRAKVNELWFVEEHDLLALALNGKLVARKFQLQCLHPNSSSV
ncbi:hypothetical protein R1sor_003450 [Riccia sorocarpa]|uniref:Uncharacterized protein n=1 Tax=Riccia sorocarpa TaxID=122646 RepID=A0ABD3H1L9_9MARC